MSTFLLGFLVGLYVLTFILAWEVRKLKDQVKALRDGQAHWQWHVQKSYNRRCSRRAGRANDCQRLA